MSNLQKTLEALQPYVIGIRYLDGMPVVDAVFKDDWTLPESNVITKVKGNNDVNYYMIFSEADGIGLDELLDYVDVIIKTNIEKEKKHELLKERVNELKELFKKTPLVKLKRLRFSFNEEDLVPSIKDLDVEEPEKDTIEEVVISEPPSTETEAPQNQEIPMTDEEREILEEERRAENYRKFQQNQKTSSQIENIKNKVELPPKKTIQSELNNLDDGCDCGPDEACSKCIDKKSL